MITYIHEKAYNAMTTYIHENAYSPMTTFIHEKCLFSHDYLYS